MSSCTRSSRSSWGCSTRMKSGRCQWPKLIMRVFTTRQGCQSLEESTTPAWEPWIKISGATFAKEVNLDFKFTFFSPIWLPRALWTHRTQQTCLPCGPLRVCPQNSESGLQQLFKAPGTPRREDLRTNFANEEEDLQIQPSFQDSRPNQSLRWRNRRVWANSTKSNF